MNILFSNKPALIVAAIVCVLFAVVGYVANPVNPWLGALVIGLIATLCSGIVLFFYNLDRSWDA